MRGLGLVEKCQFSFHVYLFLHKLTSKYSVSHVSDFQECRESPNVFFIFQKVREDFSRERSQILEESATRDYERKGTEFFFCWQKFKALYTQRLQV